MPVGLCIVALKIDLLICAERERQRILDPCAFREGTQDQIHCERLFFLSRSSVFLESQ